MGKIITFHGADRKVGVTMIAQSCAEYLASAFPDEEVLFITLNERSGKEYLREATENIAGYSSKVSSGLYVSKEEIRNGKYSNLYIIGGPLEEKSASDYHPETAEKLLAMLIAQFSIVIADTGSDIDNGLALGGLLSADINYLVMSQNEASLRRFENMRDLYYMLGIKFDGYIMNNYSERDPYTASFVKKRLGLAEDDFIYVIHGSKNGRRAEMEYMTMFELKDTFFSGDIVALSELLGQGAGFQHEIKDRGIMRYFRRQ